MKFGESAVCELLGIHQAALRELIANKRFPKPRVSGRVRYWTLAELKKAKRRLLPDTAESR